MPTSNNFKSVTLNIQKSNNTQNLLKPQLFLFFSEALSMCQEEKKINICSFNRVCVFLYFLYSYAYIYIYIYIYIIYILC